MILYNTLSGIFYALFFNFIPYQVQNHFFIIFYTQKGIKYQ